MADLDMTTRAGFDEIASAFGRERAWEARIAALEAKVEESRDFRWFSLRWERALRNAQFERDWERANPEAAATLRQAYAWVY